MIKNNTIQYNTETYMQKLSNGHITKNLLHIPHKFHPSKIE